MQNIEIRSANLSDAEVIREIYRPYVEEEATFEYEMPTIDEFKKRITTTLEKFPLSCCCP